MKKNSNTLLNYLNMTFIITYLLLLAYIFTIASIETSVISLYYLLTIPLYYYLLLLILFSLMIPLMLHRYLKFLIVMVKSLFDLALIINFFVFKSYKFHIDSLFIDMFIHDLGGLGISTFSYLVTLAFFMTLFALNLFLFYKAHQSSKRTDKITLIFIILFLINQLIHIWGSYFNQASITKYTPYFPYYLPTTSSKKMKKLAIKFPWIVPEKIGEKRTLQTKAQAEGLFHYPLEALHFDPTKQKDPNIIFIILESWQAQEMNKQTTPNIYRFSTQNSNYSNHFSSGNVTLAGLFGLMYGLYATENLRAVQSNPLTYQSLLTRSLEQKGYDIELYTSSNLYRFGLKKMFFGNIPKEKSHILKEGSPSKNDKILVDQLIQDLNQTTSKPWFKFLFLTSSHHKYFYPKAFEKNLPVSQNAEAFLFDSDIDPTPFKNRYKNALLYEDSLVKKVLKALEEQLEETIILITGDHAEEFNESGRGQWGHDNSFVLYQTHTPMILHFPKDTPKKISQRTYHIDLVPTLLKYMGVTNPIGDFSNGVDLRKPFPPQRDMIFASYKDRAYLFGDEIISVGLFTQHYKLNGSTEVNHALNLSKIREIKVKESLFFQ